jgi:Na+-driven multidrug efflux pump
VKRKISISLFFAGLTICLCIGIIIGKHLGANEFEKAYDTDRKLITFSVLLSIGVSVVVIGLSDYIPLLYNTSDVAKDYAAYFIKVSAAFSFVHAFANASYFTIRSGGKTLVTFLMDSVFIMAFSVPVAFSLYYVFHLDIITAFPIVQAVDIIKVIIGLVLVKKRVWLNNIVE